MEKLRKNARAKQAGLKKIARARREFAVFETKTREFARNTASAAEFIADTVRAESRHFAFIAVTKITDRLTGNKSESAFTRSLHHDSLEPLAGVGRSREPRA